MPAKQISASCTNLLIIRLSISDPEVRKNVEAGRFELATTDGKVISYATFTEIDQVVTVPVVFTPPEHRGEGYAASLMAGLLSHIRVENQRIDPVCRYAATYVKRHPEHQDLTA